jgi:hypothetical protein
MNIIIIIENNITRVKLNYTNFQTKGNFVRIIFAMWRNSFGPGFKIDHNFAERQDY